jgi:hypothetical protein
MMFPVDDEPEIKIPSLLFPEMTLRAVAVVPPIVLLAAFDRKIPLVFAIAEVPVALRPMILPAMVLELELEPK